MNCRTARKILNQMTMAAASPPAAEFRQHLQACPGCRQQFVLDQMTASLVKAHAGDDANRGSFPPPYFFTRLQARINAAGAAGESGVGFWEAAVVAARGWLVAFGAVAALLFAASLFSLPAPAERPGAVADFTPDVLALPSRSENILIANGESLSHDAVLYTLVSEDADYGRK